MCRASSEIDALLARPAVGRLLALLSVGGEEARLVGGAVRDALMGRTPGDIDIATTLSPDAVVRRALEAGLKAVPTGIEHGTVTLVLDGAPYEVTTLRRDVETDGRRAVVAFTRDFREDAFRRDFTMNALSLDVSGVVHDYATGVEDARAGRVRFMGDARTRIREDYLRILRFFRFHASRGRGVPDAAGLDACVALKGGLARLSRERVRQEMLKLLVAPGAAATLDLMAVTGVLAAALPGAGALHIGVAARMDSHDRDLGLEPDALLRLAALAQEVETADLRLSNADSERIAVAVRHAGWPAVDAADSRRLAYLAGRQGAEDALRLRAAQSGASADALADRLESIRLAASGLPGNPFTSADALKRGVPPGPRMGRVLKRAEALWLAEGLPEHIEIHDRIMTEAVTENPD